jgi:PAS domain S-box-containing protein
VLAVPLIAQDRVIGALSLGDSVGRVFGDTEIQLAQAFADQAAIALENARLYEEAQQRLRRMETLLAVGRTVGTTLDLVEAMRRVAREMAKALGADMIGTYLCSADGSVLDALAGYRVPSELLEDFRRFSIAANGHRFVEEAWQTRAAVWSSHSEADPRVDRALVTRFPHRSILFAPMILDGAPLGGLFAIWWLRAPEFSADDLRLADGIAHQAAIAVANGRLFARESEARAAAERSEQNRRILFANAPLPMWVFDAQTFDFLEVNEAAVAHYGYSRGEFLSMRIHDIGPREDLPRLQAVLAQGEGMRSAGEWRHRRKNGDLIEVEVVSHSLEFAGRPARLVVINDVTERKRAQDALNESEEQVRQLQKLEAVGRLAGGIAHDFNNLLTVIQSRTNMLLTVVGPQERVRRNVEIIEKTAKRAALLTAQLLAFSRKQILQPKVLDVNAVVSNVEDILRRLIGEDIDLVFHPSTDLGRVLADPGQLEQVIMNLVVNARDAMPQGGRLTLETTNVELDATYASRHADVHAGAYTMLAVSDTGIGMDAATQERIFEPFFTTKAPDKGTGLGLATAYGIVRQSGGHIGVYSEPGHGTSFKIYLPRVDGTSEATEAMDAQAQPPGRDGNRRARRGRCRGPGPDQGDPGSVRLHGVAGAPPRGRHPARPGLRGSHRPAAHRRGDAAHERPPVERAPAGAAPDDESPVHVRLHRRRHQPPRRAGLGDPVLAEALYPRCPGPQNSRGPGRQALNARC